MTTDQALKMYVDAALGGEPIDLHYFRKTLPPDLYREFVRSIPGAIDKTSSGVKRSISDEELAALINRFGSETIICRLTEQIRLLAEDGRVRDDVATVVRQIPCDAEFIFALCELTSLLTWCSDVPELNGLPWEDDEDRQDLMSSVGERGRG